MSYTKRTKGILTDYQLMSPDDYTALIFNGYQQAIGKETYNRVSKQLENYAYYNGRQHIDEYGRLVKAKDLPRPAGLDYDPTRYATNYFKAIVDRKARWQMGGKHGISVPRKKIDSFDEVSKDNYEPSPAQAKENEVAENYERLLYRLWEENRMRAKLVQAARDRLIADRVVCKIVYNDRTGKLRWIFRPDYEYIPVYSDDDFEELLEAHFVRNITYEVNDEDVAAIRKQSFTLEGGKCYVQEAIYRESDLLLLETIQEKIPLGIDFIPIQEFPVNELTASEGDSEVAALREQNDVLNQMNEDAIDSLKFEMFEITVITNAVPGSSDNFVKAPGAVAEINSHGDAKAADIKNVQGSFGWKEAFKDQYARVKGAMHEISGLPQIVPQELNFGGLNGDALHVLFHDIITDTEEHWLSWGYNLAELHEKSIKYLQARVSRPSFSYDKDAVTAITDYDNEMRFVFPLPENRKDLVELLELETLAGFESTKGAMERLGVEDIKSKQHEIESENNKRKQSRYVEEDSALFDVEESEPQKEVTQEDGE